MKRGVVSIAACLLLASSVSLPAIEGLQIAVQCPDVVLAWPSVDGEAYIVQCRATLDANSAWVTLTSDLAAATGTNWTCFVHSNQMVCTTNSGSGGGGGASDPPSPLNASQSRSMAFTGTVFPVADVTVQFLTQHRVYPPYIWDLQHRPPQPWELEVRPPLPWEPGALRLAPAKSSVTSSSGAGFTGRRCRSGTFSTPTKSMPAPSSASRRACLQ